MWRNGRRDGLKIRFPRKECRFESDHRYQPDGPEGPPLREDGVILKVLRSMGAVVAGLAVVLVGLLAVEGFSAQVHPFPAGVDPRDLAVCKAHVARYPAWVLAVVIGAWGLTGAAGAWVATRLGSGRNMSHGLVVGAALTVAVVFNMVLLPYPRWFWLNLLVLPVATLLGTRRAQPGV